MKKFSQYIKEDINNIEDTKELDYIMNFFEINNDENTLDSVNEYLSNNEVTANDLMMLLDGYEELLNSTHKMISNVYPTTEEVKYKTDDEIEDTYSNLKLQEIKFEERDMSYMYDNGVFEAMVVWEFNEHSVDEEDLTEGGYNTSVEDVMYATKPNENDDYIYKYGINNWYPENVYIKMTEIIEEKLKEKYGHEYKRDSLESKED